MLTCSLPALLRTVVLKLWSVEPLKSLRPFYGIREVKILFITLPKIYLPFSFKYVFLILAALDLH